MGITTHTLYFSYASKSFKRVDVVLAELFPHCSRNKLSRYCTHVCVNGVCVKASHKMRHGDIVEAHVEIPTMNEKPVYETALSAEFIARIKHSVLYSDETVLVINKQRGDVVHIGAGHYSSTIAQAVFPMLYSYREDDARKGRAGIVHRLDKDTSGLLLIARTADSHEFYARQFAHRAVKKTYLSIVKGSPPQAQGEVVTYIARDGKNRKKFYNYADATHGKEAHSRYCVHATNGNYSVVQWNILTGRTHQIRVHAQYIGCPVLGDSLYARPIHDETVRHVPLMLHAWKLHIALHNAEHVPEQGLASKELCSPIPHDMLELCRRLFDYTPS